MRIGFYNFFINRRQFVTSFTTVFRVVAGNTGVISIIYLCMVLKPNDWKVLAAIFCQEF